MKNPGYFSLRYRLIVSFGLMLLIMTVVGWRGIVGMQGITVDLKKLRTEYFLPSQMINQANDELLYWNRAVLNHVLAEDEGKMETYKQVMDSRRKALLEALTPVAKRTFFAPMISMQTVT